MTRGDARGARGRRNGRNEPGAAKRTEGVVAEATGSEGGAEEGTVDERRGTEDAKRPTAVGTGEKATAS